MPGSNPLFGLNTLGGALSIQTKDGARAAARPSQAIYGSDLRRSIEFEHGGRAGERLQLVRHRQSLQRGRLARRLAVGRPADLRQGRLAAISETSSSSPSVTRTTRSPATACRSQRSSIGDYASVYTKPDTTNNRSTFLNVTVRRNLSHASLGFRQRLLPRHPHRAPSTATSTRIRSISRSTSRAPPSRPRLPRAGYTGFPTSGANASNTPFPSWRCIANVLLATNRPRNATA